MVGSLDSSTLKLPGCDTDTFELFLYWLHNKGLPSEFDKVPPGLRSTELLERRKLMVQLWGFGNAYLMPKIQNVAMNTYLNLLSEHRVSLEEVSLVAELAPQGSPLWVVTMDELAHDHDSLLDDGEEIVDHFANNPGAMVELIKRLRGHNGHTSKLPYSLFSNHESFMVPENES
jgi:hypothetical protein